MPLARATRRRNPVATTLRDAVVLLAVLAIGTTVQVSIEPVPTALDAASRAPTELSPAAASHRVRPAGVGAERWIAEPENAVLPPGAARERQRSSAVPGGPDNNAGPAVDRGVTVEIPPIAARAQRLLSLDRS
jgi:hypothetical protein